MGKKGKMPDMNLPIWFDGQNINEALFCEEFLRERRIIFANGAFFTPCVQRSWTTLASVSPVTVIASEPCS